VAGVLFLLFFAAAAPSPLYGVYQAQWRFSAITLTAVFAVYALLLLITLLVFGSVSDYLGPPPRDPGRPGDGRGPLASPRTKSAIKGGLKNDHVHPVAAQNGQFGAG
jgi:hypothetical protein